MRNKTLLAAAAARLIFGTPALCVAQGAQDSAPAPHVARIVARPPPAQRLRCPRCGWRKVAVIFDRRAA